MLAQKEFHPADAILAHFGNRQEGALVAAVLNHSVWVWRIAEVGVDLGPLGRRLFSAARQQTGGDECSETHADGWGAEGYRALRDHERISLALTRPLSSNPLPKAPTILPVSRLILETANGRE